MLWNTKQRALIVFDLLENPPENQDYTFDLNQEGWESESHVLTALKKLHFDVELFGVFNELDSLYLRAKEFCPDVIVNLSESFAGSREAEDVIPKFSGQLKIPCTGANPKTLINCKNKAKTKEIVSAVGVDVPFFALGSELNQNLELYPALVKPVALESSQGIQRNSYVKNYAEAVVRVEQIIRKYGQESIVEEFIDGNEFQVAMIEKNGVPVVLGIREVDLSCMPEPQYLFYRAKWSDAYRSQFAIHSKPPTKLAAEEKKEIEEASLKVWKALQLTGYARIDFRQKKTEQKFYFLECNPNPSLSRDDEFALAAKQSGMNYTELVLAILEQARVMND